MKKHVEDIAKYSYIQTKLAIERTALSYARTSFAFMAFGLGIFSFFEGPNTYLLSLFFAVVGTIFLIFGVITYIRRTTSLN
ncbi:DUF202 domain-containing protein [bacterium]|nr:DUF202 domain-containing protein [bacterium]